MSLPVIWWNGSKGNWDSGLLSQVFEKNTDVFIEYNEQYPYFHEKAIVIIVGKPEIKPLRTFLETLKSGLVILTSEEEGTFDWKSAIPEHLEIWTQYYQPKTKSEIKDRILLGVPNRFKDYKINTHLPKKYLWSYIGQVQHPQREQCVEVLKTMSDGFLHIAEGFGGQKNGIEYQEYLDICCQSEFVICPAGNLSAESFRVYEALETDSIPIVDRKHFNDHEGFNYWNEVYPNHRLLVVEYWGQDLKLFLKSAKQLTTPEIQNKWWFRYKEELEQKLLYYAKD